MAMANIDHPNVPGKGISKTVDPIRDEEKLREIKDNLRARNPRDYCLFILGINTGIRVGDILKLKVEDVYFLHPGDSFKVQEGKTRKWNTIAINEEVFQALWYYLNSRSLEMDDYLFRSMRINHKNAINTKHVRDLVKRWTAEVGLKGNYGSHTLRKTFGYWQRVKYNVAWEVLAQRFNHASLQETKAYLGITNEEIAEVMMNEI